MYSDTFAIHEHISSDFDHSKLKLMFNPQTIIAQTIVVIIRNNINNQATNESYHLNV